MSEVDIRVAGSLSFYKNGKLAFTLSRPKKTPLPITQEMVAAILKWANTPPED